MTATRRRKPAKPPHPTPIDGEGYLGIDPGISGGIAWIGDHGAIWSTRMPVIKGDDGRACLDLLAIVDLVRLSHPGYACIERVSPAPCWGQEREQGVTGMFSFGRGYGEILGILATLAIPVVKVTPQSWKKQVLGPVLDREDERANPKARALAFVAENYPGVRLIPPRCRKPHDGIADAVCLAHLARDMATLMRKRSKGA